MIKYTWVNEHCIYPTEKSVNSKSRDFNLWRRLKPDNYADVCKITTHWLISPFPPVTASPSVQLSWLQHCPSGTFELYDQKRQKGHSKADSHTRN